MEVSGGEEGFFVFGEAAFGAYAPYPFLAGEGVVKDVLGIAFQFAVEVGAGSVLRLQRVDMIIEIGGIGDVGQEQAARLFAGGDGDVAPTRAHLISFACFYGSFKHGWIQAIHSQFGGVFDEIIEA